MDDIVVTFFTDWSDMRDDPLEVNLDPERLGLVASSVSATIALFQRLHNEATDRGPDRVLVASWKKRDDQERSCPIPSAKALSFVLMGYFRCNAEELQFWSEPEALARGILPGNQGRMELYTYLFL